MNGTWAYSSLPVYDVRPRTGDRKAKRTNKKAPKKPASSGGPVLSKSPSVPPERPLAPSHILIHDMSHDFMGPAIDGPPSPESIRALNKQMRRTSVLDKHQSHQTSSSGSSSIRSLASGRRPSWEHGFEGITLSRKSSGRSTASSMPTRERPDSVQIFGKTIFNRRGKLRRETSPQSSAASSLYSAETNETMPPPTSVPAKEFGSKIFGRRRTLKSDAAEAERKYQISGPYNFQHVTHTNNDQPPDSQRTSTMGFVAEYNSQFADFSSEALPLPEGSEHAFLSRTSSYIPQLSPRRMLQHTRSQDQLRGPPPRPPRSPIAPENADAPLPPPRLSSRVSMRHDGFDPIAVTDPERPITNGGFRHPRPFGLPEGQTSPAATSPRSALPADDANWPLPCPGSPMYESFLAGVPEEDENAPAGRAARTSMASNSSSLRASQSVPLLRQLSLSQSPKSPGHRRPPSAASDTLGRFDLLAAQRALKAALQEGNGPDEVERESWEDDIDWCYEHEAEADCDFAWDRPSLDINRDGDTVTPVEGDRRHIPRVDVSSARLTPVQFDMPALSPCSQASTTAAHEAVTPTGSAVPKTSNFSLPKRDAAQSQRFLHVRKSSDASSFKESHGFTLSPSLLIPSDYREQMQAHEAEKLSPHSLPYQVPYEEPTLTMDKSALFIYPRTSASTTGSNETDRSQYSERHISTTSASTDFTRLTMSTTSLDIENFIIPKPEITELAPPPVPQQPLDEAALLPAVHARAKSHGALVMPSLSESEETADEPGPLLRRGDLSASDPNLVRLAGKAPSKRRDPLLARRRARTTSLSTPPPPGQYALFPSVQISGNRI
ncbi:Pak-box p21-rho-binding protein [Coniochaeta hoffmannii]|uniref:Pak-box p21-rho-binding protein n=1 Tax=Coniochaeta hoffmannii TaxID=91930 RepID=A0AA38S470_9PEZI|nr:Pak-box p21-rho-binding protein [Coniochaeta hoffmannii]